jgi:hypothetical protein
MPMPTCESVLAGLATSFESGAAGFTHVVLDNASAAGWPLDEWQLGTATTGPGSCHAGTKCWATRVDANYTSCSRAALVSPAYNLSACVGRTVNLTFWHWHDFWTGTVSGSATAWYDGGIVQFSTNGTTWTQVTPQPAYPGTTDINPAINSYQCVSPNNWVVDGKPGYVGASGGWQQVTVPIPASALGPGFRLRFAYSSGVSYQSNNAETNRMHTRPGWYLDDLAFTSP